MSVTPELVKISGTKKAFHKSIEMLRKNLYISLPSQNVSNGMFPTTLNHKMILFSTTTTKKKKNLDFLSIFLSTYCLLISPIGTDNCALQVIFYI